jgi:hypothetical protein
MRRLITFLVLAAVIGVVAALAAVSSAKVELTASGVYKRLLVPLGAGAAGFRVYSGTGEDVVLEGHLDGPVVRRTGDGSWSAIWFCEDHVQQASGGSALLRISCAGKEHDYPLESAPVPAAVAPMPEKLVVLSDLEGNIEFLDAALGKLGIVDDNDGWQFGRGQLVVLGDSVDRGRDVFAVLWRLHDLARQAHAAGGAVRLVLGNHDQYILRGNISRAHPEHLYALREMGGVSRAFAADTVIGAWLRSQPVMLKLGRVVFVHGGISPDVVDAGLSIDEINRAMREYWQEPPGTATHSASLDAVLGNAGLTQYRGYFRELDGAYPAAKQADVDRVLAYFDADQIVVGHTIVDRVERLHGGRVFAVDVNDDEARPDVLTYINGVPKIIDIGVERALATQPRSRTREFSLLAPADRQLLADMLQAYRKLSDVPQPY